MSDNMLWNGIKVILSKYITETKEVRARKHKAKRVDKKWLKKYGFKNIQIPNKKFFHMIRENAICMHPKTFEKIKHLMEVKGV